MLVVMMVLSYLKAIFTSYVFKCSNHIEVRKVLLVYLNSQQINRRFYLFIYFYIKVLSRLLMLSWLVSSPFLLLDRQLVLINNIHVFVIFCCVLWQFIFFKKKETCKLCPEITVQTYRPGVASALTWENENILLDY